MKYFFQFIALVFCTLVSAQNTDKWKTYNFGDWCSLKIPNTMELRDANSDIGKFINEGVQPIIENTEAQASIKRMVFQPKGMNSLAPQDVYPASSVFARVIVRIVPSGGWTQSDVDELSEVDIKELNSFFYEDYYLRVSKMTKDEGFTTGKFQWFPLRRIKYSGRNALVIHYKRPGMGDSVDATEYHFFLRGEQLLISICYRDSEKSKWAADFSKIISTLKIL